jgi:hypothetical protein
LSAVAASDAEVARIRAAVGDVLRSAPFRNSRQSQSFLTYIVDRTLAGENDLLKERIIGAEVFGRNSDYEPSDDPIVRVRAAEVRKRLAQYYQDHSDGPLRIDIPPGSYKAVFQWKPLDEAVLPIVKPRPKRRLWIWVVSGLAAAAVAILVARSLHTPAATALDRFWAPALASAKPILIYNATMTIYQPGDPASPTHEMIRVRGQYTCIGDAYTSLVLSSLFSGRGKLYQVRYGSDLSFGDLRYQPSILIGAFNNAWTLQTTNELPITFDRPSTIRDRLTNKTYTLPELAADGRTPEDYAIVSRVFDSKTGELLIAAAGITQYGTRAAGEFLTSAQSMAALAAKAPPDWPKKNLQVLLHAKIVDDMPGPPSIVAAHFW